VYRRIALLVLVVAALLGPATFARAQAIYTGGNIPFANPQPISFAPGTATYPLTAHLNPDVPQSYSVAVQAGQIMYLSTRGAFRYQVYDPLGVAVTPPATTPAPVGVSIQHTGSYGIAIQGQGDILLNIYVPPVGTAPSPVPPPVAVGRIRFAPGTSSATVHADLHPGQPQGYLLGAGTGQLVTVSVFGNAIPTLSNQALNMLWPSVTAVGQYTWGPMPVTADYLLVLSGTGPVDFVLSIPPLATPAPPRPVSLHHVYFAPGATSATRHTYLYPGYARGYVLTIGAGQTLYVTASTPAQVWVVAPNGAVLATVQAGQQWSTQIPATGNYTVLVKGSGWTYLTFMIPPLAY
jgi:hypothetical protein